jgi:alpha-glucosidase
VHNDVSNRERLAAYDPELFMLLQDVFRKSAWRYERYDRREAGKELK